MPTAKGGAVLATTQAEDSDQSGPFHNLIVLAR